MTAQARLSQWFTMESERGGGRGGGESWHVYRCIASATYWCRRSWVAHPCQERTWFLQTGCKFFSPLDSLFSSVVFKWLLSAVVSSLQLMYFFWVFQHPGTPSCRILVFYFFGLSSHLLPVSVGVSCVLLWEIKHSIHVMSFVFPRAVNVHAFLSSLLSPLHFVITKSIWFEDFFPSFFSLLSSYLNKNQRCLPQLMEFDTSYCVNSTMGLQPLLDFLSYEKQLNEHQEKTLGHKKKKNNAKWKGVKCLKYNLVDSHLNQSLQRVWSIRVSLTCQT